MEKMTGNKKWYAVYTTSRAEKKVKERFEQSGIECYLPLQVVTRVWSDRKKQIEIPIISGYIFVYVAEKEFDLICRTQGVAFILKEKGKAIAIPSKQIDTLKFMVKHSKEQLEFSTEKLHLGENVIVIRGQLEGLIGELIDIRGKYKVVLRINGFGNIMTTIPISMIKKI